MANHDLRDVLRCTPRCYSRCGEDTAQLDYGGVCLKYCSSPSPTGLAEHPAASRLAERPKICGTRNVRDRENELALD